MKYFLFVILITVSINAQNEFSRYELDELFNLYKLLKTAPETFKLKKNQIEVYSTNETINTAFNGKCGLPLNNLIQNNFDNFSPSQQNELIILNQRPTTQTSVLTPSGLFRVHYDITGTHAINYDINLFLEAVDSSYRFQVDYLGFLPPPNDNGAGGGNEYDIYIRNIGSSVYGETKMEDEISPGKFTSYILINNNFNDFYTKGIDAARVTIAHELHHAIQLGSYINRYNQDAYFYEISSTAMEEFVFDSINDYYPYMRSFFNNPTRSFNNTAGYDFAIWNIFIQKRYDFEILKRQWELMPEMRAISAINKSLTEKGSTFKEEFNIFGIWTYFTGHRSNSEKYFKEGNMYPLIRNQDVVYTPPSRTVNMNSNYAANNYLRFNFRTTEINDTIVAIITNGQWENLISNSIGSENYVYGLHSNAASGLTKLSNDYYAKFDVTNILSWSVSEIINDEVVKEGLMQTGLDYAYPMPFFYSKNSFITIPVKAPRGTNLNLNIYNSSMMLVYTSNIVLDKKILWNALDLKGEKLPSGVYIYAVEYNSNVNLGKIVILND